METREKEREFKAPPIFIDAPFSGSSSFSSSFSSTVSFLALDFFVAYGLCLLPRIESPSSLYIHTSLYTS